MNRTDPSGQQTLREEDAQVPRGALVRIDGDSAEPTTITVSVPANATVRIDGRQTQSTGPIRSFVTPPLATGRVYTYKIEISWIENGTRVFVDRFVDFRPGEEISIDARAERKEDERLVKLGEQQFQIMVLQRQLRAALERAKKADQARLKIEEDILRGQREIDRLRREKAKDQAQCERAKQQICMLEQKRGRALEIARNAQAAIERLNRELEDVRQEQIELSRDILALEAVAEAIEQVGKEIDDIIKQEVEVEMKLRELRAQFDELKIPNKEEDETAAMLVPLVGLVGRPLAPPIAPPAPPPLPPPAVPPAIPPLAVPGVLVVVVCVQGVVLADTAEELADVTIQLIRVRRIIRQIARLEKVRTKLQEQLEKTKQTRVKFAEELRRLPRRPRRRRRRMDPCSRMKLVPNERRYTYGKLVEVSDRRPRRRGNVCAGPAMQIKQRVITKVVGWITATSGGSGTTPGSRAWVRCVVGLPGDKDDAGHVIANSLGGSGAEPPAPPVLLPLNSNAPMAFNLFPQNLSKNRGLMQIREGQIVPHVNAKRRVCVVIHLLYSGDHFDAQLPGRPGSVVYNVWIDYRLNSALPSNPVILNPR